MKAIGWSILGVWGVVLFVGASLIIGRGIEENFGDPAMIAFIGLAIGLLWVIFGWAFDRMP